MKTARLIILKGSYYPVIAKSNRVPVWWLDECGVQTRQRGDTIARFFNRAQKNLYINTRLLLCEQLD